MFDISRLSPEELSDYRSEFLLRTCIERIKEFYTCLGTEDLAAFSNALFALVLQFDPLY